MIKKEGIGETMKSDGGETPNSDSKLKPGTARWLLQVKEWPCVEAATQSKPVTKSGGEEVSEEQVSSKLAP